MFLVSDKVESCLCALIMYLHILICLISFNFNLKSEFHDFIILCFKDNCNIPIMLFYLKLRVYIVSPSYCGFCQMFLFFLN